MANGGTGAPNGDPWFDITAFGADPTGINDSLPAFEAAHASACTAFPSGAIIWAPIGKYRFSNIISNFGCNGLTFTGAGVRATELDFPTGSGYAITETSGASLGNGLRNITIENFLIVVGGGSSGTNNSLGGIFIGNFAFTHEYRNLYIIGPTTSTAIGIGDGGDSDVSTINLDNVRVDNFGGTNGEGFQFIATGTGTLGSCKFCYSTSAYIGIEVGFFATFNLESSAVDGSSAIAFYLHPGGTGYSITGKSLSGEGNKGDVYRIYGNGAATAGGIVVLDTPIALTSAGSTAAKFPFNITNYAGDVTLIEPMTGSTGGSSVASLNISNTPKSVTIIGCDHNLDKGFSASASTYLTQKGNAICSN